MSQSGILNIENSNPQIPTLFVTDDGDAIPIANTLELLGEVVANAGIPFRSVGSGNTVTYQIQYANETAVTDATIVGVAAFDSAAFDVDANGFVTLLGGGVAATNIDVDASTAPGTDPVVPDGAGNIVITGAQVASGVVGANVIRSDSLAANSVTIEIQRSTVAPGTDSSLNGVSHFNSAQFSMDANGFVSLAGAGTAIDSIGVQTGTNPIVATAAGLVTINGAVVAAGTNPVRTDGTGANTMAVEVQISQALAATDATKIGLCNFDSAAFDVDANGFVTLNGGGIATSSFEVQANTAPGTDPVVPSAIGVVTVNGAAVANHSVVIETHSRAANAYNLEIQYATSAAATDATKSGVAHFDSANFTVDANGFVSLTPSGGFTWNDVSGAFSPLAENGYFVTGTATGTLPAGPSQGDTIKFVVDHATEDLTIDAPGTQLIRIGTGVSSAGGTATSNAQGDSLTLVYRASTTTWMATEVIGTWTLA